MQLRYCWYSLVCNKYTLNTTMILFSRLYRVSFLMGHHWILEKYKSVSKLSMADFPSPSLGFHITFFKLPISATICRCPPIIAKSYEIKIFKTLGHRIRSLTVRFLKKKMVKSKIKFNLGLKSK